MSDFSDMDDMLQDFLTEALDLLSSVDNNLVALEKTPDDKELLNHIFRGFHTIKGGAGFLNAHEMVVLCHHTENLFDKLRNTELTLSEALMDVIMDATAAVRAMFDQLSQGALPTPADQYILRRLEAALQGEDIACMEQPSPETSIAGGGNEPDWEQLYQSLVNGSEKKVATPVPPAPPSPAPRTVLSPAAGTAKDTTIRVDTSRLDQVLNLSGEIGLTKNRLSCIRTAIMQGKYTAEITRDLDEAVSHLELLVGDLQNAVMKTRMQPVGRLFQKYPRLARDVARQLGKDVELVLSGEATEIDKTMIEDINDPLVHLIRNAVDHGVDSPEERVAIGKPAKSLISLSARQLGDHIIIEISDDGRGIRPDVIRQKALEKGLIDFETANNLDERQSLQLIFLPGVSTKNQVSDVSGRGVGMDVVKTNIQRLNGRVEVNSVIGRGTTIRVLLPLTLAILPVLMVRLGEQPFAVPLSMVREIVPIQSGDVQHISGKATMVVREDVLPILSLASLIGWEESLSPAFGVLMQCSERNFILAVDSFIGQDDVVIKSLHDIKPKGVAGATLTGEGAIMLVLDMEQLLNMQTHETSESACA